ncbi:MAG TPA: IclR family transcriptional regulator [Acidimicrobiales bacterium]|nr:IclR family transcriptional regulator [Acidimicrobiales bacterium]
MTERSSRGYGTVHKAMAVISAFSYGDPVLGVSELSRRLGLGKSTVHRILTTLADDGFVERTNDERYRLSIKMYELGQQVAASIELRELVHPALERLRNESGETAHVAVLSGADVVYVDRLESPQMLRLLTRVGRRRAAHATSSGKCLLAFGAPADVAAVLATGLPRLGPRTITSKSMLDKRLADVRRKGYATSVEEAAPGVASVAAPIFDGAGECIAAVSVTGPVTRLPAERLEQLARLVLSAASSVSATTARSA